MRMMFMSEESTIGARPTAEQRGPVKHNGLSAADCLMCTRTFICLHSWTEVLLRFFRRMMVVFLKALIMEPHGLISAMDSRYHRSIGSVVPRQVRTSY